MLLDIFQDTLFSVWNNSSSMVEALLKRTMEVGEFGKVGKGVGGVNRLTP